MARYGRSFPPKRQFISPVKNAVSIVDAGLISLTGTTSLTPDAFVATTGLVAMSATAAQTTDSLVTVVAVVPMTSTTTFTESDLVTENAAVMMAATTGFTEADVVTEQAAVVLTADTTLTEATTVITTGSVLLDATACESIDGVTVIFGLVLQQAFASLAVVGLVGRWWVGGTGTWDGTTTTHWSYTPSGTGGAPVPTSLNDVFIDSGSGTGTITMSVASSVKSLDFTGYTGTFTQSGVPLTVAGSLFRLVSGMTYNASTLNLNPAFGTTMFITTAGRTLSGVTFGGAGVAQLQDGLTSSGTVTHSVGTFDSNGFAVNASILTSNTTNNRTLTLGSSTITLSNPSSSAWNVQTLTGLTITANTATVVFSGTNGGGTGPTSAVNWNGLSFSLTGPGNQQIVNGAQTFANVTRTGSATKGDAFTVGCDLTVTGTLTMTGNSAINRLAVGSSAGGVQRTITAANVVASNVDMSDMVGAGAFGWDLSAITGGSGDAQGNSGITFTPSVSQSNNTLAAGVSWSNAALWPTRVPLPQDDVNFRGFSTAGQTIVLDMPRLGHNVTFATGTGGYTVSPNAGAWGIYGNFATQSNVFWSGGATNGITLRGRSSHTINTAGSPMAGILDINTPTGTYTLSRAVSMSGNFTVTAGNFASSTFNVTCATFVSNNSFVRSIDMGTSTWNLSSTAAGTVWNLATSTNLTLSAASATIAITAATASARTFQSSGGQTYGTLTYTVNNSSGALTLTGSSNFDTINFSDATVARTLFISTNNTMSFRAWNVTGGAARLVTIKTPTNGVTATIRPTASSSLPFVSDYLTIQDINAQAADGSSGTGLWYAGDNSVNNGNNTGWIFTGPQGALLTATAGMSIGGVITTFATVAETASAAMTIGGDVTEVALVTETATTAVTTSAAVTVLATVTESATTTQTVAGTATVLAATTLVATTSASINAVVTVRATVTEVAVAGETVAGNAIVLATTTLTAATSLSVSGILSRLGVVSQAAITTETVGAVVTRFGAVSYAAVTTLLASGILSRLGVVSESATTTLTSSGAPTKIAATTMSAQASLTMAYLLTVYATVSELATTTAVVQATVIAVAGMFKVWNGTIWMLAVPKGWDGTQWVPARVRVWDGSTWKMAR